ncbi:hypothetical protein CAPTEDRAFT_92308 [Capitella teleta]|uniref:Complex 1 LYR protein domain-containing protein n=1 Tax=Capitella teleta TaxID=283909 RepID=R7UAB9_CAPTE|nr:hypothetical protein CAPTEDRAFT_92308 [Capitella teleta]|eukprot:ELU03061.1 hypothetical protein CAPTEDRAFT_92308 [Capitella teleta]
MHNKIQLQVLSLYRQCLRAAKNRPGVKDHVREEFRSNASLPKLDTIRIEYLMRRGHRQLEQLSKSSVKGIGVFEKTE